MGPGVVITGGLGFIGSHATDIFIDAGYDVYIVDKCTYAANIWKTKKKVREVVYDDISECNWTSLLLKLRPQLIVNFAAESSVDASIHNAATFIKSNVTGVYNIITGIRQYQQLSGEHVFFEHVSTDEVYGDTNFNSVSEFVEVDNYCPNNPYSATKAAAEQLIRACYHTHGDFSYNIVRGCNNYGPGQHCEKFIPATIRNAIMGEPIIIHGKGNNIREWVCVKDFARTFKFLYELNDPCLVGEIFNSGSGVRISNLDMARNIIRLTKSNSRIIHVEDRPGNDRRYAINSTKIREIGFKLLYNSVDEILEESIEEMRVRYGL